MRGTLLLLAAGLTAGSPSELPAQTATAFKTGERTTGQTRQCYYDFAGKEYTKTVESYQLCPLSIQVRTTPVPPSPPPVPPADSLPLVPRQPQARPAQAPTVTAFKTGEQTTGQTKQCYYSFAGKRYTKTVESYQLCPLSIKVPSS
jgi:hypothetical protein